MDDATGVRAMLARLENIKEGQRRAELEFNASKLPKDYLKNKYERKRPNDKPRTASKP